MKLIENKKTLLWVAALTLLCCAAPSAAQQKQTDNTLSAEEKAAGWKLLFDGKTSAGWRGFHKDAFPTAGWAIGDGCIKHVAGKGAQSEHGGDIITTGQYQNFELQLDWRLAAGGNSGIKYLVVESLPATGGSGVAPEMQVLDDDAHPDAKMGRDGNRTAGALYDLIAPSGNKKLRPVGEFNQARLVVNNGHVEHWLNGEKVVEFDLGGERLRSLIAQSKYKSIPKFAEARRGHILLQDHGDEVCYRNVKIRELPAAASSKR